MHPEFTGVPRVIAVVDYEYVGDQIKWLDVIRALSDLPGDPRVGLQIRVKNQSPDFTTALAIRAREAFRNEVVSLSWNGDAEQAASLGYNGCHQPESRVTPLGAETGQLLHSASVHDIAALENAQACNVDFVTFSPIFMPNWKDIVPQGISKLEAVLTHASVPVIALGGITLDRLPALAATTVYGVACLSTFMDADDPVAAVIEFDATWRELQSTG